MARLAVLPRRRFMLILSIIRIAAVDILERRFSDGGVEFSDSRSSYAAQPGKVRIQWKLWVSTVQRQQTIFSI